ncbi:LysR substrate-binding domain-containing protein [Ruegeria sp. 2205SS24-7]|uniref:LysR substrate-binding domain-containing protein n=1 Tax=Ruegeria discodermiae TaxID=3064389 RepID=UPI002740ECB2|nr:LysR substrate-binding domain-containing protein [Ruegeria sp. 2205SS24-7]MDP5218757.1 LysR substrate-binding domain-containing protein [Ruegeria sp. 2205SS24-7]
MARNLPPLPAIRVFEAAARHKSFTAAASELGMTQAAVSYQVKVLEERVGASLFERHARGVGLTPVGEKFYHRVSASLDILADAFDNAQGAGSKKLSISVIPTFATNFLAQRLAGFQSANPEIVLRLELSEALMDFSTGDCDVAVRGGRGKWDGLQSELLMPTRFTPMLAPSLLETVGGLKRPEDLMKLPILSRGDPWWVNWFSLAGSEQEFSPTTPPQTFGPQVIEAGAAIAGQGVAMLTPAFFQNELNSGVLVQPFDLLGDDGSGYWLVYPESRRNALKIKRFRNWLTRETAEFRAE